ncbi:MAG: hypothetical protein HY318_02775, partial [Armatimonadetes bacterium]|nr:hypothetical protein [Armatimonadota bacterium]
MAISDFPDLQSSPLPDLGSHCPLVEAISSRCEARMSFLRDEFTDLGAWQRQARARLRELMAYEPPVCDFCPEVVERVDRGSFIRERVMISLSPETRIPVYVLIPKDAILPGPGIVALHDHGGFYLWGTEKVIGTEEEHPALAKFKQHYGGRSFGDEFAKAGFVVVASDMLHWGERRLTLDGDPPRFKERSADLTEDDVLAFSRRSWLHEELLGRSLFTAGATWSGVIAHDDCRVTDYLLTRPEVDPKRVGCLGLS